MHRTVPALGVAGLDHNAFFCYFELAVNVLETICISLKGDGSVEGELGQDSWGFDFLIVVYGCLLGRGVVR